MMAKGDGEMAPTPVPVLAVGLGRGFGGKSTGLSELGRVCKLSLVEAVV